MTTVTLGDDLVVLMRDGDESIDRVAQEMIVLELFRRRTTASGRAAELLRMSKRAFVQFAADVGIPFFDLSADEWDHDLRASRSR